MSDLFVGSMIAGCRLESVAGRGGMGVVYRATQLALDRPVALKAIAPQLAADLDFRERFQRESYLAASIEHPNVIPVYEAGESDGTLYLIMRWVEGTDLRALLNAAGRLEPARALRLLRPVASALAAAHRRGLVHRDVKPGNVLIAGDEDAEDDHVYLTDFGIAQRTDTKSGMTRAGVLVGTMDYTAPERIEGAKATPASDIYAFGCMLFETLTGHVPFDRAAGLLKLHAHLNDPIPSVRAEAPDVPEQLDAIIHKAMAKQPDSRFASAGELAGGLTDALAEIETGETIIGDDATHIAPDWPTTDDATHLAPDPATTGNEATHLDPDPTTTGNEATRLAPGAHTPGSHPSTATAHRPPPPARPPGRSPWPMLAGALALAIVAVVAIVALSGGGSSSSSSTTTSVSTTSSTSAPAPPPATSGGLRAGRTVDLGAEPGTLAADPSGNLWISEPGQGVLARIDASTGRLEELHVGGSPQLLASVPRGVWVSAAGNAMLERLDAGSGASPVATATLPSPPVALAGDPGDGSVWAAEPDGTIVHFDGTGGRDPSTAQLMPAPAAMAVGEGWLWAVGGVPLTRIGTFAPHPITPFPAVPNSVAVTFDQGVWTAGADGHVRKFDPRSQFLLVRVNHPVAPRLDAIAAVEQGRFVWVASAATKTVYRLAANGDGTPNAHAVFASPPVGLAVAGQSLWVATKDGRLTPINS